ncbi:hypothetical protein B1690_09710 [Geobacillus sp. 46C-IIa]|uniref:YkoP family protein n=1 Tax=Geobacillus sp. 46C-IIa TaxID=1963025 RepID=UPI0009BFBEC0|nr:hypothetical protein [Geobacillus sp. 46C-IIa]OQP06103.1 hypothetical protein B1690_09710 [Geobacillus sp. 46C-IIa]QNU29381.1 hypothetical protein IC803_07680 [Geobacillus sp. 46C-IIa]
MKEKAVQCLLAMWGVIDPIYYACSRLEYAGEARDGLRSIFRVRPLQYKGETIRLSDGTTIAANDWLLKIHLHNVRLVRDLFRYDSDIKKGRYILEQVKAGLPYVAYHLYHHEQSERMKGIIGITMLNKGCERLGFETVDISNPLYRWFKTLALVPMMAVARPGLSPFSRPPKYLLMSKEKLFSLYGYHLIH